jgi:Arsenite-resistance protein 2
VSCLQYIVFYATHDLSRELSRVAEPYVKQEDEGKFRCKTCQKLFKATPFVEKHIANKHPELVKLLDDVYLFHSPFIQALTNIFCIAPVLQQLCA